MMRWQCWLVGVAGLVTYGVLYAVMLPGSGFAVGPGFPDVIDRVYVYDIVLVPAEARFVVLSMTPRRQVAGDTALLQHLVGNATDQADIRTPLGIPFQDVTINSQAATCRPTQASSGDGNIDESVHTLSCSYAEGLDTRAGAIISLSSVPVVIPAGALNARPSYAFRRLATPTRGVSVAIKTVRQYSPFITDLLQYYRAQGMVHVYLCTATRAVAQQYSTALAEYLAEGLVSIAHNDPDTGDLLAVVEASSIAPVDRKLKAPFINAALFHAKSFDRFMVVVDMDEVVVPARPESQTLAQVLEDNYKSTAACFLQVSGSQVNCAPLLSETKLQHVFPNRTDPMTPTYDKSIAVVANANHVSLHVHDNSCVEKVSVPKSVMVLNHYSTFYTNARGEYKLRWRSRRPCNVTAEFTRAMAVAPDD